MTKKKKRKIGSTCVKKKLQHTLSSSILYESRLRITRVSPRGDVFLKVSSSPCTFSLIGPPSRMTITNVNYFYICGVDIRPVLTGDS